MVDTLTYLTLVITYQCSSRCAHCCLGAGPEFRDWMAPEDAKRYIAEVTRRNQIAHMTLIGGEALLEPDRAIAIGEIALRHGIASVDISTNASWAGDEHNALAVVRRVLDAGLELGISVDVFHQQHVPRERALGMMRAANKLGLTLKGSSVILEAEDASNIWDRETARITAWFREHGFEVRPGRGAGVVFQGHAINLADQYNGPRSIPQDKCVGVPWFATSDFRRLGGIQIDAFGWVMVEHGICIGNAKQLSLGEILGSYDPATHPIIGVLMAEGPIGLTRIPEAEGFQLREDGYVDKCHLCHEVRTYLRSAFPNVLGPANYYPQIQ